MLSVLSSGEGAVSVGSVVAGVVALGPGSDALSGPHDGPMFGTGGGVSNTGSTATGPLFDAEALVGGSGVVGVVGLSASPTAGVTTEGAVTGVVLSSGADNPDGTLDDAVVLAPGAASVAGRIWLEAARQSASAPASTRAAGAASFFTITPRLLVAPKYGRGFTCPGTIVPWGCPDNACGIWGIFDDVLISDRDIRAEIDSQRIVLEPYDPAMVQPSSVDVRIDRFFRLFDNHKYAHIDPAEEQPELTRLVEVEGDEPFILHPGEFVLGSTYETVSLADDIAARLEGKSSLGRLGLLTHSTAGFIDPGFSGHVTLELSNVATLPIKLWPGMKIGQLCFFRLTSSAEHPYGSGEYGNRYQGQRGPTASRSHQNFHRTSI
ncbi:dCTP deaminase, dUMP-forming [Paenarthrobacter nitroguajacolicus]|nr:dCTP deaminase, dUMP-forming [Paenarthrobacter nitroguajacolicus]